MRSHECKQKLNACALFAYSYKMAKGLRMCAYVLNRRAHTKAEEIIIEDGNSLVTAGSHFARTTTMITTMSYKLYHFPFIRIPF